MSVPARFVHVGIGVLIPPVEQLEKMFGNAMDWLRYDSHCWIIYTSTELDIWRDRIRTVVASGSFFLCEFEAGAYSGYPKPDAWKWLQKQR